MSSIYDQSLVAHKIQKGKLSMQSKVPLENRNDLSLYYSPGVAAPCLEIAKDPTTAYDYTRKSHTIAVVSDGTAVLWLGNIGWLAGLPVMEGKAILFKKFGNVDAVPIVLESTDPEETIRTIINIAPTFGGINLEDIKAPECFYIEEKLREKLSIPVFHDDQHGTAIMVLAWLINALKVVKKNLSDCKIVLSGAWAAGIPIVKLLALYGAHHIIALDSKWTLHPGREWMNAYKDEIAHLNRDEVKGPLAKAVMSADIFIGVSGQKDDLTADMIRTMAPDPIIFALSNPDPEVDPINAKQAGAAVIATGRSDHPNQLNNVLVFPGIFRGILDAGIRMITDDHKIAAAEAIAWLVTDPTADMIIPSVFDERVAPAVAEAVKRVG